MGIRTTIALTLFLTVGFSQCGWCQFSETRRIEPQRPARPIDYRLKYFSWAMPLDPYTFHDEQSQPAKLTKVTVQTGELTTVSETRARFVPSRSKTTTEPSILREFERHTFSLGWSYIPALDEQRSQWTASNRLLLEHDGGTIELWMGDGFAGRQELPINVNGIFYSEQLTEVIDRNMGMTDIDPQWASKVKVLSGKARLQAEKQEYPKQTEHPQEDLLTRRPKSNDRDPPTVPPEFESVKPKFIERVDQPILEVGEELKAIRFFLHFDPFGSKRVVIADLVANDPETLRQAERGLATFRFPLPHRMRGNLGVSMRLPNARLEFLTNKDRAFVIVPHYDFGMVPRDGVGPRAKSWILARVLDDLLIRATGKGLSDRDLQLFSGSRD